MRVVAEVDFGTLSVRVTLLDSKRGQLGTASATYLCIANATILTLPRNPSGPDGSAVGDIFEAVTRRARTDVTSLAKVLETTMHLVAGDVAGKPPDNMPTTKSYHSC